MTMTDPQPSVVVSDDEKERLLDAGHAWVGAYLADVPFEELYQDVIQYALVQLGLALGPRLGKAAVSRVLSMVINSMPSGDEHDDIQRRIEAGDPTVLREYEVDVDWQDISAELACLFAYARYGHGFHTKPDKSQAAIEASIAHYRRAVSGMDIHAATPAHANWLIDLLAAAEARWALDHGRSVAPDDLAALADVKAKTIANLLAARELATDSDGRILAAEALRYLERRDGFIRSHWQYPEEAGGPSAADEGQRLGDQVFVPVDAQGHPFLPSVARRGRDGVQRYAIGPKEDPDYVDDYWEALARLARMRTPRWRRPPVSGKGGWSLVSAQDGWVRYERADLEAMIAGGQTL